MPSAKLGGFKTADKGKYLVLRRDATVPTWTWFVMGALDPHAPAALRAYAASITKSAPTPEELAYAVDVQNLAAAFHDERVEHEKIGKKADPEKGPHRKDVRWVAAAIERTSDPDFRGVEMKIATQERLDAAEALLNDVRNAIGQDSDEEICDRIDSFLAGSVRA